MENNKDFENLENVKETIVFVSEYKPGKYNLAFSNGHKSMKCNSFELEILKAVIPKVLSNHYKGVKVRFEYLEN